MFKYINMPKLVAFYLREFSVRSDGDPSLLYRFVFCLCLPFISKTFRRARMNALAIAQCTNSTDQILRVLSKITGATVSVTLAYNEFFVTYSGSTEDVEFTYDDTFKEPLIPYGLVQNSGIIYIVPGDADRNEIEAYLKLLTPFYVKYEIKYVDTAKPFKAGRMRLPKDTTL